MSTYYVGPGGNDGNSGLTWALRKLTLNGAEDVPVVAGDTVYVGPGVYRELLTCDVSGGAGTPITYIGDITGEHTDGVGGFVRITGSDNDQTVTRGICIVASGRNYRTVRGFTLDLTGSGGVGIDGTGAGTDIIIEDCTFQSIDYFVYIAGTNQRRWTIRRCVFFMCYHTTDCITIEHFADVSDCDHIIENCIAMLANSTGNAFLYINNIGGITLRNSLVYGGNRGVWLANAPAVGQTINVNNCHLLGIETALRSPVLGYVIEDYNNLYANQTDRTNVAVGANSVSYAPLFDLGHLHAGAGQASGFQMPQPHFGALSPWSTFRAVADTGPATTDLVGLTRPVTAGKRSWGPVQFPNVVRDATTVRSGNASLELSDAGRAQLYVPVDGSPITVRIWVYREANYAGTNPQMVIKQPGQADRTTTDTGAAATWNLMADSFTPAADPEWIVVELVSNNTAAAGNYAVYWDDLEVV